MFVRFRGKADIGHRLPTNHDYAEEIREAFVRLAELLDEIVGPNGEVTT